jgi:septum formation protein
MAYKRRLILASTSVYRRELLGRLKIPFEWFEPGVDEQPLAGESAEATALRLAEAKARAIAQRHPDALIVGSDQVADLDGERLGKPGSHDKAVHQLRRASGRTVVFNTAVCVHDSRANLSRVRLSAARVTFRRLGERQIETYLLREQPYDCAGSAKAEGLGIALIERIDTDDPTSLIGLPLIALTELLGDAGLPVIG